MERGSQKRSKGVRNGLGESEAEQRSQSRLGEPRVACM